MDLVRRMFVGLLVAGAFVAVAGNASAETLDFEDHAVASGVNNYVSGSTFSSGSFTFDIDSAGSIEDHYHFVNDAFDSANGTTWLGIDISNRTTGASGTTTMSRTDGGAFSMSSLELSEFFGNPTLTALTVLVTGNLVGGGTVTETMVMDLVSDGTGAGDDFQTETFGAGWGNLLSVDFEATSGGDLRFYALDNIEVGAAVPEPGTLALLALGLGGLVASRRRSRKARASA